MFMSKYINFIFGFGRLLAVRFLHLFAYFYGSSRMNVLFCCLIAPEMTSVLVQSLVLRDLL